MVNPKAPQAAEDNRFTVNIYGDGDNRVAVGSHNDQGDGEQPESRSRWLIGLVVAGVLAVLGLLGNLFSGVFSEAGRQALGGYRQSEYQIERATDAEPRPPSPPGRVPEPPDGKFDVMVGDDVILEAGD